VWFAGYTPQIAAAVWVGDPRGGYAYPMKDITVNGVYYSQVYGGTLPGPIWRDSMEIALAGTEPQQFDLKPVEAFTVLSLTDLPEDELAPEDAATDFDNSDVFTEDPVSEPVPLDPAPAPTAPAPAPAPPPPVQPTAKVTVPKALTLRPDGSVTATCGSEEKVALSSCTVTLRANASLADGPGGGVTVRAAKRVVIGRATATATGGETSLKLKVKLNERGRRMLRANLVVPVTVAMSITSAEKVTAEATGRTRLSTGTHTVSPDAGIFDELGTTLNAKGRAFVKRLAAILPKAPASITCTGYADSSGVPGDNRWLGDRRARALCDAQDASGIEAKRTTIVSKGATSPRDDNSTAEGRERNRRATVTITY